MYMNMYDKPLIKYVCIYIDAFLIDLHYDIFMFCSINCVYILYKNKLYYVRMMKPSGVYIYQYICMYIYK